jgi:hypothetical protein
MWRKLEFNANSVGTTMIIPRLCTKLLPRLEQSKDREDLISGSSFPPLRLKLCGS